jgi:hypothetical protein
MNPNPDSQTTSPVRYCWDCGEPLTEIAASLYWDEFPDGIGKPRCLDCRSVEDISGLGDRGGKQWHLVSWTLCGAALSLMVLACFHPQQSGYFILAAIGCGSFALMALIFGL